MLGMIVAQTFRRNTNTTSITKPMEINIVRSMSLIDARIVVVRSTMTEISIDGGMDALNKGSKSRIRSTVSMILAFGCLNTCTTTAGFPFARPAFRRSSNESSTVAISDIRMGAPLLKLTIRGLYSSALKS